MKYFYTQCGCAEKVINPNIYDLILSEIEMKPDDNKKKKDRTIVITVTNCHWFCFSLYNSNQIAIRKKLKLHKNWINIHIVNSEMMNVISNGFGQIVCFDESDFIIETSYAKFFFRFCFALIGHKAVSSHCLKILFNLWKYFICFRFFWHGLKLNFS